MAATFKCKQRITFMVLNLLFTKNPGRPKIFQGFIDLQSFTKYFRLTLVFM